MQIRYSEHIPKLKLEDMKNEDVTTGTQTRRDYRYSDDEFLYCYGLNRSIQMENKRFENSKTDTGDVHVSDSTVGTINNGPQFNVRMEIPNSPTSIQHEVLAELKTIKDRLTKIEETQRGPHAEILEKLELLQDQVALLQQQRKQAILRWILEGFVKAFAIGVAAKIWTILESAIIAILRFFGIGG